MSADPKSPIIREHTLERIARFLGDQGSGPQIVAWLQGWGVPENLIEYPNTKWRMIYDILRHYACSADKKGHEMLFKIISEILHPLMFNGDKAVAQAAAADFNKFLEYDGVVATYSHDAKRYYVYKENEQSVNAEEVEQLLNEELFQQEHSELEFLRQPENREKISILRKTYQLFMNIVEVFCGNPSKPSHELNDAYISTKKLITDIVRDLRLYVSRVNGEQKMLTLSHYSVPFNNLFTAEKEYTPDNLDLDLSGRKLTWDYIRPLMHATYGDIDDLYRKVDGSDVLSKPDVQQTLNDVSLLLSKTKEEDRKRTEAQQGGAEEKGQSKSQKIIDALDDAVISGLKNMSFSPQPPVQQTAKKAELYITKNGDDFSYKGRYINLSKKTDYYRVFAALYALLPKGGEVSYKKLIAEIKSRLESTKTDGKSEDEMRKFIQRNLTDKNNGFMRYAGIPETEDSGKSLIEVVRGSGVVFNNKMG